MGIRWRELYAERARSTAEPAFGKLLDLKPESGIISLAGGLPAPELFPAEAFREALDAVMVSDPSGALQYGASEGYSPLREFLAERMSRHGIPTTVEEVLITTGSQQGLDLLARLFVDPGSTVLVEDPSYAGALEAFQGCQARYVAIPSDGDGMLVDVLVDSLPELRPSPRLMYVLTNFQNPSGCTMSLERRRQLLELSYRHGIPILEDDPYWELRYEGEHIPSLKSLDVEGNVIYVGTFSKILAPGLRLGWVVAPQEVIRQLAKAKQAADLHTDSLAQRAAHHFCRQGLLDQHIEKLKPAYRERRDTMLRAVASHLPPDSTWSRPHGGLFLWGTLASRVDTRAMLADALQEKVAYVPGAAFHPLRDCTNTLRLNFSCAGPDQIEEGIRRLGRVLHRWCQVQDDGIALVPPEDLTEEAA